jgi:hypothetical protein
MAHEVLFSRLVYFSWNGFHEGQKTLRKSGKNTASRKTELEKLHKVSRSACTLGCNTAGSKFPRENFLTIPKRDKAFVEEDLNFIEFIAFIWLNDAKETSKTA